VQAVYLFDFAKFVRWPAGAENTPMQFCTAAPAAFEQALARTIAGGRIDGRELSLKHVEHAAEVRDCDILYIDSSFHAQADALVNAVAGKPALTVGDGLGFLARGGMIQFLLVENRVRFAVNLGSATRAGLSLSSELLKVAVSVDGRPAAGGGS
jgi:hypothetical protein